MDKLQLEQRETDTTLWEVGRGLFVGCVIVLAVGVWAISFEPVFLSDEPISPIAFFLRIALCDAVPLATLIALYKGVGRNESAEHISNRILRTVLRRPAREPDVYERHDAF